MEHIDPSIAASVFFQDVMSLTYAALASDRRFDSQLIGQIFISWESRVINQFLPDGDKNNSESAAFARREQMSNAAKAISDEAIQGAIVVDPEIVSTRKYANNGQYALFQPVTDNTTHIGKRNTSSLYAQVQQDSDPNRKQSKRNDGTAVGQSPQEQNTTQEQDDSLLLESQIIPRDVETFDKLIWPASALQEPSLGNITSFATKFSTVLGKVVPIAPLSPPVLPLALPTITPAAATASGTVLHDKDHLSTVTVLSPVTTMAPAPMESIPTPAIMQSLPPVQTYRTTVDDSVLITSNLPTDPSPAGDFFARQQSSSIHSMGSSQHHQPQQHNPARIGSASLVQTDTVHSSHHSTSGSGFGTTPHHKIPFTSHIIQSTTPFSPNEDDSYLPSALVQHPNGSIPVGHFPSLPNAPSSISSFNPAIAPRGTTSSRIPPAGGATLPSTGGLASHFVSSTSPLSSHSPPAPPVSAMLLTAVGNGPPSSSSLLKASTGSSSSTGNPYPRLASPPNSASFTSPLGGGSASAGVNTMSSAGGIPGSSSPFSASILPGIGHGGGSSNSSTPARSTAGTTNAGLGSGGSSLLTATVTSTTNRQVNSLRLGVPTNPFFSMSTSPQSSALLPVSGAAAVPSTTLFTTSSNATGPLTMPFSNSHLLSATTAPPGSSGTKSPHASTAATNSSSFLAGHTRSSTASSTTNQSLPRSGDPTPSQILATSAFFAQPSALSTSNRQSSIPLSSSHPFAIQASDGSSFVQNAPYRPATPSSGSLVPATGVAMNHVSIPGSKLPAFNDPTSQVFRVPFTTTANAPQTTTTATASLRQSSMSSTVMSPTSIPSDPSSIIQPQQPVASTPAAGTAAGTAAAPPAFPLFSKTSFSPPLRAGPGPSSTASAALSSTSTAVNSPSFQATNSASAVLLLSSGGAGGAAASATAVKPEVVSADAIVSVIPTIEMPPLVASSPPLTSHNEQSRRTNFSAHERPSSPPVSAPMPTSASSATAAPVAAAAAADTPNDATPPFAFSSPIPLLSCVNAPQQQEALTDQFAHQLSIYDYVFPPEMHNDINALATQLQTWFDVVSDKKFNRDKIITDSDRPVFHDVSRFFRFDTASPVEFPLCPALLNFSKFTEFVTTKTKKSRRNNAKSKFANDDLDNDDVLNDDETILKSTDTNTHLSLEQAQQQYLDNLTFSAHPIVLKPFKTVLKNVFLRIGADDLFFHSLFVEATMVISLNKTDDEDD